MPTNLFLPTEDETAIVIHFADGQEPLSIDAIDVELVVREVQNKNIPEGSSLGLELALAFEEAFKRKIAKNAAIQLWNTSYDILLKVKKKLYGPDHSSDTSTSEATAQNET